MPSVIVAVGGTGQHIALAAARLRLLGALPEGLSLLTIDGDTSGTLTTSLTTFDETVEKGRKPDHPLLQGDQDPFPPFDRQRHQNPRFADLLIGPQAKVTEREIFECLFDEESANVPVNEGMFGQPMVGATVFALEKNQQLKDVFTAIEEAQQVFVVGSFIGGTGAGILHQLVKTIQNRQPQKDIYGIFFLPWISMGASKGDVTRTIDDSILVRNMQYGLHYFYEETRERLKASLLIGAGEEVGPFRKQSVEQSKGEVRTPLMYLAAKAIHWLPDNARQQNEKGSVYAASATATAPLYDDRFGKTPLSWYVNRARYVGKLMDYAGGQKFRDEMESTFKLLGSKPENIGLGLHGAIQEIPKNTRTPNLDRIQLTWRGLASQYKKSLVWLDGVLGQLPAHLVSPDVKSLEDEKTVAAKLQAIWRPLKPKSITTPSGEEIAMYFAQRVGESFPEVLA